MPLSSLPRFWASNASIGPADLSPNTVLKVMQLDFGTLSGSPGSSIERLTRCPCTGMLYSITMAAATGLAVSNTAYLSFTVTNKAPDGNGTTVMLATTPPGINSTQATGGLPFVPYVVMPLTLAGGAVDQVNAGDVLAMVVSTTGNLNKTIPETMAWFAFLPSS